MKKIFIVILIIAMSLSFISCNKVSDIVSKKVSDAIDNKIDDLVDNSNGGFNSDATDDFFINSDYDTNDEVLADSDDMKITLNSIEDLGPKFLGLNFELENKKNIALTFSSYEFTVNGYVLSSLITQDVEAMSTEDIQVYILKDELRDANIGSVDELFFILDVYNANDFDDNYFYDIVFTYPTGLTYDDIYVPEKPMYESEQIVVDDGVIEFTVLDKYYDEFNNYVYKIFIKNDTDNSLDFSLGDTFINDGQIYPYFVESVFAHCNKITELTFEKNQLLAEGINDVEKIEFNLFISDSFDYDKEPYLDDVYTVE